MDVVFAVVHSVTPHLVLICRSVDKLNVHLVCHSHHDPGWLKTYDQGFLGTRNDYHVRCLLVNKPPRLFHVLAAHCLTCDHLTRRLSFRLICTP